MPVKKTISQKIIDLNVCVLIPTYNNDRTLKRVIDGVLKYTESIIIINDGSTDTTSEILKEYPNLEQLHIPRNKGKGNALRLGFKKAEALGYLFAITIDSDGQHFPEDISVFMEELENSETQSILLIGARNMEHESVPGASSFGNKFSNFWYKLETGIELSDTQSGYRMYPLKEINKIKFYTSKFEFEIENIVKAAWKGITVKNVPIKVLYDESERVSHFRPFKDFTRISILNTWFVLVTFLLIKPRNLFRKFQEKGIKRFFKEDLLASHDTPETKAKSIALGVFIGLSPLWGLHTLLVLSLAVFFKLNKAIAFAFSNVSLPPFIPFIVWISLHIGALLLGEEKSFSFEDFNGDFELLKSLKTYIVGSFVFAFGASILSGGIGYITLKLFQKKK